MNLVVLDTNVVVSGLLQPYSPPGELMRLVARGELRLAYDVRIMAEYREVLIRPRFAFPRPLIEDLLAHVSATGLLVTARALPHPLPDPSDEPFLAVAITAQAGLVTGNLKHYPVNCRAGAVVQAPRNFLQRHLRQSP